MMDLLIDLVKHGISKEELKLAKDNMKAGLIGSMENNINMAMYNGTETILFPEKEWVAYENKYQVYFQAIEKEDVDQVIRKYFRPENMFVSLLGSSLPSKTVLMKHTERFT